MNLNNKKFKIVLLSAAVLILRLLFESSEASALLMPSNSDISNSEKEYVALEQQASSTGTLVINLPIVEQNAPTSTSTPIGGYPGPIQATPSETFTPTPTPIPIQTGSTNVPIVLGVIGIIFVILIAWLFFGYLPQRSKG
jgi:hypothetical protein